MLKEQLDLKSCPALHVCAIMLDCVFLFMYQAGGTGVMVNVALQTCCSTSADMGLIYGSKEQVRSVYSKCELILNQQSFTDVHMCL